MAYVKGRSNPATTDPDYSEAERIFLRRVDEYRRRRHRKFPTCGEYFAILLSLGYRQVETPGPLPEWPLPK